MLAEKLHKALGKYTIRPIILSHKNPKYQKFESIFLDELF